MSRDQGAGSILTLYAGIFDVDSDTHFAWFRPFSYTPLHIYQTLGALFAVALHNGIPLPVSFPLALYRILLGQHLELDDFQEGWPALAATLSHDTLAEHVRDGLELDFSIDLNLAGGSVEANLDEPWDMPMSDMAQRTDLPLGKLTIDDAIAVDEPPGWEFLPQADRKPETVNTTNLLHFQARRIRWVMDLSVRPQLASFLTGFRAVMDADTLSILNTRLLRELVQGHRQIDIGRLRDVATYENCSADHTVVKWFWEVAKDLPEEKRPRLLEFVTSNERLPASGYEGLSFVVECTDRDSNQLPTSSTCAQRLHLPAYKSVAQLREKLYIALENSTGFGIA